MADRTVIQWDKDDLESLKLMKVDVLDKFDEIKACTHYKLNNGTITDALPFDLCDDDYILLYFWWCPSCKTQSFLMAKMIALLEKQLG